MWRAWVFAWALLGAPAALAGDAEPPMRVTFINPGSEDSTFWGMFVRMMREAAEDLNVRLEVLYTDRNHVRMVRELQQVTHRPTRPDVVLIANQRRMAPEMLRVADAGKQKVFLVANHVPQPWKEQLGPPGVSHAYWIGALTPDNHEAGRMLAERLIDTAAASGVCRRDDRGRIQLMALYGERVTPSSVDREAGLKSVLAERDDVALVQEAYGDWRASTAERIGHHIFARHPDACIVWSANDEMLRGILGASLDAGRRPGEDLFLGSIDGSEAITEQVLAGRVVATVGGHYVLGAAAIAGLRLGWEDRLEVGKERDIEWPVFRVIDQDNAARYLRWMRGDWSHIDFARVLRERTPGDRWDLFDAMSDWEKDSARAVHESGVSPALPR